VAPRGATMMPMTDPTIPQAFTLETLAHETQHAIPCARCARRPAVVLDYLCAECDALEASPATVPWTPAEGTTCVGCPATRGACGRGPRVKGLYVKALCQGPLCQGRCNGKR
jgi:hypothetical protein